MIELLWVSDAVEAQSERARPTLLWQRWSGRHDGACPFGICTRPADAAQIMESPFPAWEYRPEYLPDPLVLHIGQSGVDEPMWIYMSFQRRAYWEQRFVEHPIGIREITGLALTSPAPLRSTAAMRIVESGILSARQGAEPLLAIEFDGNRRGQLVDFRPDLPLVFHL